MDLVALVYKLVDENKKLIQQMQRKIEDTKSLAVKTNELAGRRI